MHKRAFTAMACSFIVLTLVTVSVIVVVNRTHEKDDQASVVRPSGSSVSKPREVAITGKFTCLKHRAQGLTTMECAIGFSDENGVDYAIKTDGVPNFEPFDTEGNFVVTGTLRTDTDAKYQTSGTIVAREIKKL